MWLSRTVPILGSSGVDERVQGEHTLSLQDTCTGSIHPLVEMRLGQAEHKRDKSITTVAKRRKGGCSYPDATFCGSTLHATLRVESLFGNCLQLCGKGGALAVNTLKPCTVPDDILAVPWHAHWSVASVRKAFLSQRSVLFEKRLILDSLHHNATQRLAQVDTGWPLEAGAATTQKIKRDDRLGFYRGCWQEDCAHRTHRYPLQALERNLNQRVADLGVLTLLPCQSRTLRGHHSTPFLVLQLFHRGRDARSVDWGVLRQLLVPNHVSQEKLLGILHAILSPSACRRAA